MSAPSAVPLADSPGNPLAASGPSFVFDSGFSVIHDGATIDLGPFDISDLEQLRILARAVNGDMHIDVLADVAPAFPIELDSFTLGGERGTVSGTRVYDVPPPSVIIRLTESGPGGSNYHVVLVGG